MKLKHLTIFFLLFAILAYVVFMVIQNNAVIEAEKARIAEIEKAEKAKKDIERAARIAKAQQASKQRLFNKHLTEITKHGYGLDYDIDIAEAILKLEDLIAQGANPNEEIEHGDGDIEGYLDKSIPYLETPTSYLEVGVSYLDTPISYIFLTCVNDDDIDTDGKNFI